MRRSVGILAALAAVLLGSLVAIPAAVSGAAGGSLWVSNVAALSSAPGTSCSHPGYSTIQSAIDAAIPGSTIQVCSGTYTEQLSITKSLAIKAVGSVNVVLPATPANATTSCDNTIGTQTGTQPQEEVSICGATVSISGIAFTAFWPALTGCAGDLSGIFVGAGGDLIAKKVAVDGAGNPVGDPNFGCQHGVGIAVGTSETTPVEAASATLGNVTVTNFQKDGIRADGTGTVLKVTSATVTGPGPAATGQNGIEVLYGAKATVSGANVSDLECDDPAPTCGPDGLNNYQADGALFYGAAPGSSLTKSTFTNNDVGAYYGSDAATEPATPEVAFSKDTFTNNRYIGIQLDQGNATVADDTIDGTGDVGIEILQYIDNDYLGTQTYAPAETANGDTITGQGVAVQVYSDDNPADFGGSFTISHSHFITGNSVAQENNSDNFTIGGLHNS